MIDLISEIEKNINKRIEILSENITIGRVSDWAHYRHQVGLINGLNETLNIIKESAKTFLESDD